jgi:hypothetical protein
MLNISKPSIINNATRKIYFQLLINISIDQ